MKIRMIETIKHDPRVEIILDSAKFDTLDATITVLFFGWEDNKKIYNPRVWANINMGKMNPEIAMQWADCLQVAYQIATRAMPSYIESKQKDIIAETWIRVDGIKASLPS